jgi:DNA-binding NarL/FixJ family response regulator
MGAIASLLPPVTSAASNVAGNEAGTATPLTQNPPQPQPSTATASDTVQLSEAQRVYQLYNQGLPIAQIASNLSLSEAAVNGYLNITNTGG